MEEYRRLAEAAAKAKAGMTAELLDCLVDKIDIFPDRHIEVAFRFSSGFALLREVLGDE